jgi:NTE family protein
MPAIDKKTVSLVLGSGGARGLAHIGIIHWLEENGFVIESVSGCSMGALVGGVYAAGKLDEFENWIRAIDRVEMVTLLDLAWNTSGLVKGDKIINSLMQLVGDVDINDLPVKYTAVAADIVRASISLPLFFTPFRYRGIDLIDGGVLNPVPIAPTFSDGTDLTIAVNLNGKLVDADKVIVAGDAVKEVASPFREKVFRFVESLKDTAAGKTGDDWNAYDVANQAFDAMQSTIARQKLAAYPADQYIEIARNACGTLEFDLADEMIELGYQKAGESLGQVSHFTG